MAKRIPFLSGKKKICIICEGNEEYFYLKCLRELNVWNTLYEIELKNAEGNGNIPARYQDCYQNGAYELVLIFCDTEKKPYKQYEEIKTKIDKFHGVENVSDSVIIFANPCTMQVVIKHWADDTLKSPAKHNNAPLVEKYTNVKGYKGKENQIQEIMEQINKENYKEMCCRADEMMKYEDTVIGSSNFRHFIKCFESKNIDWIDEINRKLEQ